MPRQLTLSLTGIDQLLRIISVFVAPRNEAIQNSRVEKYRGSFFFVNASHRVQNASAMEKTHNKKAAELVLFKILLSS